MKAKEYAEKYIGQRQKGGTNPNDLINKLLAELCTEFKESCNARMSTSHIMSVLDSFMSKAISIARKLNIIYPGMVKEKFFYYYIADHHEKLFKEWSTTRGKTLSNMNMYRIDPVKAINPKGFDEIRESLSRKSVSSKDSRSSFKHSPSKKNKLHSKFPLKSQSASAARNNSILFYKDSDQAAVEQEHKDFWELFDQAHPKPETQKSKEVSSND